MSFSGCTVWLLFQLSLALVDQEGMWTQTRSLAARTAVDIWAKSCKMTHFDEFFSLRFNSHMDDNTAAGWCHSFLFFFFGDVVHNYIGFTGFAKFFYPRAPKKFAHTETSAEQNYHLFKEFNSSKWNVDAFRVFLNLSMCHFPQNLITLKTYFLIANTFLKVSAAIGPNLINCLKSRHFRHSRSWRLQENLKCQNNQFKMGLPSHIIDCSAPNCF